MSTKAVTTVHNNTHATISIPKKDLLTDKGLASLIFEIFNASPEVFKKIQESDKRLEWDCDGMDTFAVNKERAEWETKKDLVPFRGKCASAWDLPPDPELDNEIYIDWDLYQFMQNISGHTDQYRMDWIEHVQKRYCEVHPTDEHSCKAKKSDLIDDYKLSEEEKVARLPARICQLYPCAHEQVKSHETIQLVINTFCPEVLSASKECIKFTPVEHECNELKLIASSKQDFVDNLCKFFPTSHKKIKNNQNLQEAYRAFCKSDGMSTTTIVAMSAFLGLATAIYRCRA